MAYVRRIVLLGKSGSGKSSLGNTILGDRYAYTVNHSPNSDPSPCRAVTRTIHRRPITLIDTPGLFNTNNPITNAAFSNEIMRCLKLSAPGPHAFILVLKKENFTPQERQIVELILKHFSPEALRFTTIVFTHGDELEIGVRVDGWARQGDYLRDLLQKCGNRCHVVDNVRWGGQNANQHAYRNNNNQVMDLLDTIDQTVMANRGSYFTNNLTLTQRFLNAPIGVQIAAMLGVSVVGYLLLSTVPWATVSAWVIEAARRGVAVVWQNLPTEYSTEEMRQGIVYLVDLYQLFMQTQPTTEDAVGRPGWCAVM